MSRKGKSSEVGADGPTEGTKSDLASLVDGIADSVVGAPAQAPKSTEKEIDNEPVGLDAKDNEDSSELPDEEKEEGSEETSEGGEAETETEEVVDEVIPASKYRKMQDKSQRRIDELISENKALKDTQSSTNKSRDERLDNMAETDLRQLRTNTDVALQRLVAKEAVSGDDMTKEIHEHVELKEALDDKISTAPNRLRSKQLNLFMKAAKDVADIDPEIINRRGKLFELANSIFTQSPSLMQSETGGIEALSLAVRGFSTMRNSEAGREKANALSKKVTNLKRKTTLDSKSRAANVNQIANKNIRNKAVKGTYYDKLDFIKSLIPDDFLQTQ